MEQFDGVYNSTRLMLVTNGQYLFLHDDLLFWLLGQFVVLIEATRLSHLLQVGTADLGQFLLLSPRLDPELERAFLRLSHDTSVRTLLCWRQTMGAITGNPAMACDVNDIIVTDSGIEGVCWKMLIFRDVHISCKPYAMLKMIISSGI